MDSHSTRSRHISLSPTSPSHLTFVSSYGTAAGVWPFLVSVNGIEVAAYHSFPRALLVTVLSKGISYAFGVGG